MPLPLIPIALVAGGTIAATLTGKAGVDALTKAITAKDTTANVLDSSKVTEENIAAVMEALNGSSVFSGSSPAIGSKNETYNPVHEDNSTVTENHTVNHIYVQDSQGAQVTTNQQPTNTTTQTPTVQKSTGTGTGFLDTLTDLPLRVLVLGGLGVFCVYKLVTGKKGGNDA